MASGSKRRGAGERVLESKHVIALFMVMLLLSGAFFTLGFLMGRDQNPDKPSTFANFRSKADAMISPKKEKEVPAKTAQPPAEVSSGNEDPAAPGTKPWEFYDEVKAKPGDERLKPVAPAASTKAVPVHTAPAPVQKNSKSMNGPLIPKGAYMLQVAALTKQADALDVATRLQKKKFPAFVVSAQADKYYRVQVGPFADQKAAEAARKGLESAGFKAIVKH